MNTNLYEKIVNENGEEIYKPYDITKTTICGKKLEEVVDILQGLDLEKQYDLEMTMKNFREWTKEYHKEHNERINQVLSKMFDEEK